MVHKTIVEPVRAAVLGRPVDKSLSPEIFDFLSNHLNVPLKYDRLDVGRDELEGFLNNNSPNHSFLGWNITIPHKETILSWVDEKSKEVDTIGAANVIHFQGGEIQGLQHGYIWR